MLKMRLVCRRLLPVLNINRTSRGICLGSGNIHRISRAGSITSNNVSLTTNRTYCDDPPSRNDRPPLPPLMRDYPEITWPSLIKSFRNFIYSNFIIRPHFDRDFDMKEFVEASKQAVEVVSNALKDGDFNALDGLVEPDLKAELKDSISNMSVSQREQLVVNKEDIYFLFPYEIGVIYEESQRRWVEITMCYHVLKGFREIMDNPDAIPPGTSPAVFREDHKNQMSILNYRFIREFTKGVEDSWLLNVVHHFKPADRK